ncbi:hypothetical protein [Xanthobacter versatilis]
MKDGILIAEGPPAAVLTAERGEFGGEPFILTWRHDRALDLKRPDA